MIGFKLPNKIFGFVSKYCFAKVRIFINTGR